MYKKTAYALLSLAFMGGALVAPAVASAAAMPIVGWAWSAGADSVAANNIPKEAEFTGWIQFAPLYYDFNNDGTVTTADTSTFMPIAVAGGPCPSGKVCDLPGTNAGINSSDALALNKLITDGTLGVYEDTVTGDLAGYAWSENLGWISFNASEVAGCPLATPRATCAPYVDKTNGRLMGWARACSAFTSGCSGALNPNTGPSGQQWDGFISLSGKASSDDKPYGVIQDESCNWSGMSWGDGALNWVSFEGPNYSVRAATTDSTACKVSNTLPDLISSKVSPTTVLPGASVAYSATISNQGLSSTTASFYNLLQRTDFYDPLTGQTGTVTDIRNKYTTTRLGRDVPSTNVSFTATAIFTAADVGTKQWLRVCADKSSGTAAGAITEGTTASVAENKASKEENNNCGDWTEILINGPDLGVVGLEPANATVGIPVTFDATLTNGGGTATGLFKSSVYICLATDEACKNQVDAIRVASTWWQKLVAFFSPRAFAADPPKATLTSAAGIGAGASGHQFGNYTFTDKGTYTLLLCADKPLNEIRENNEKDNCGDWKIFVVEPAVNPPNGPCSKSNCDASVTTQGTWDATGTVCSAPTPPEPPGACSSGDLKPVVGIKAVPPRVRKDRNTPVTVTWSATNVKTCDIKGGTGGSAISVLGDTPPVSDSRGVIVNVLTKYTMTCLGADDSTVSTSTTVNILPIPIEF